MAIEITMPRLSDTMESGTVLKWNVAEGDTVASGDVVADVETDKATMELTVFDGGTMAKILVPEGQPVDVGTTIAMLAEEGEDASSISAPAAGSGSGSGAGSGSAKSDARDESAGGDGAGDADADADADENGRRAGNVGESGDENGGKNADVDVAGDGRAAEPAAGGTRVRISPVARRLADEHGIDVKRLNGSGPGGRIIKRDVLQAVETAGETRAAVPPSAAPSTAIAPASDAGRVPVTPVGSRAAAGTGLAPGKRALSNMRQTIAKRLVESKTTIPHFTVTVAVNADPLLTLRETINAQLEAEDVKLSVNDFLVRACAVALVRHPVVNSSWAGDAILRHGTVHIGVAVALPEEKGGGLVVPTLRDAQDMPLRTINSETKRLATKAREQGLSVEEMSDGTFTLSNLGMFGVDHFEAIINPPQAAILAIGAAIKKPVVRDGQLAAGHEMELTISCDHRVIDGASAAMFMATLKELLEKPAGMLV
jgi:pyruvate dehydrogenase E2 component (dihydrolipoamide acetyltransferase)